MVQAAQDRVFFVLLVLLIVLALGLWRYIKGR